MKKNLMKKQVLRAISIGLSAVMVAATPMSVLAAEDSEPTGAEPKVEEKESVTPDLKERTQDLKEEMQNTVAEQNEDKASTSVSGTTTSASDAATDMKNAFEEKKDLISSGDLIYVGALSGVLTQESAKLDAAANSANKDMNDANAEMNKAENAANNFDTAINDANQAASDAKDVVDDLVNTLEGNEKEGTSGTNDIIRENQTIINNATTVEEAKNAYDVALQAQNAANQAVADAKTAYELAKKEYEDALKRVDSSSDEFKNAVQAALEKAESAATHLKEAQEIAGKLEEAAKKALERYQTWANVYGEEKADDVKQAADDVLQDEIKRQETGVVSKNEIKWADTDKTFEQIMKNYYLPNIVAENGERVTIESMEWTRFYKNTSDQAEKDAINSMNYYKVTFRLDNGELQTKYYNYSLNESTTEGNYNFIKICEKTAEDVTSELKDKLNYINHGNDGKTSAIYQIGDDVNNILTSSELDNLMKNEKVVWVESGSSEKLVYVDQVSNDNLASKNEDKYVYDGNENTYYKEENGTIYKVVTQGASEIVYSGSSLSSDFTFESKEAAEQAAKDAVENVDGYCKDSDITVKEEHTASITYTTSGGFSLVIDLDNCKSNSVDTDEELATKVQEATKSAADYITRLTGLSLSGSSSTVVFDSDSNKNNKEVNGKIVLTFSKPVTSTRETITVTSSTSQEDAYQKALAQLEEIKKQSTYSEESVKTWAQDIKKDILTFVVGDNAGGGAHKTVYTQDPVLPTLIKELTVLDTKYGYDVKYAELKKAEDQTVEKYEVTGNNIKTNTKNGDTVLLETDSELQDWVKMNAKLEYYGDVVNKANTAKTEAELAKGNVDKVIDALKKLVLTGEYNELVDLEYIKEEFRLTDVEMQEIIDRLTPDPVVTPDGNDETDVPETSVEDTATIDDVVVALAAVASNDTALADQAVLGARRVLSNDLAVLGARRGADQAVLGKRRSPKTGDSSAMMIWLMSLGLSATVAAAALTKLQKKKED